MLLADDLIQADKPTLAEMIEVYETYGGNVVSLMKVPDDHTSRYGIIDPGQRNGRLVEIRGLVEKPAPADAPSNLAIVGRYVLQPSIMHHLSDTEAGAGDEIQLTDSMMKMVGEMPFNGLELVGTRYDCGTKAGFLTAGIAYALMREDVANEVRKRVGRLLEQE